MAVVDTRPTPPLDNERRGRWRGPSRIAGAQSMGDGYLRPTRAPYAHPAAPGIISVILLLTCWVHRRQRDSVWHDHRTKGSS
jgi:hypothetical protein